MFPQAHIVENEADVALAILGGLPIQRCGNTAEKCNHWARLPSSTDRKSPYWCLCCNGWTNRPSMPHQFLCDGTRV